MQGIPGRALKMKKNINVRWPKLEILAAPKAGRLALIRYYSSVSYTHLRAHETEADLVCRLLLEKKKKQDQYT